MQITFEMFKQSCREAAAQRFEATVWQIVFEDHDFQREWHVTVRVGNHTASDSVNSAYVGVASADDVVAGLKAMIDELSAEAPLR
jgi:hypothetical protein